MTNAIEARTLGKRYLIGEHRASYDTVREAVTRALRRERAKAEAKSIWALREISFDLPNGEVLGLVGRNGAGKTTLLKLVSRITEPTEGLVRTRGRVGAILEIGTGFHPELTGAENIVLGGAVLGTSRRDIRARFDEIVEFAGIERFLDTPLKRYSNGMRLRLAFSVAAHVEPEILAVDEVLAVGDAEFQNRCLNRMSELHGEGRTVVFVSHDHGAITRLCSRAIWLDQGRVLADGEPAQVVAEYLRSTSAGSASIELRPPADAPAAITSITLTDDNGEAVGSVERDRELGFTLVLEAGRAISGLDVAVFILNAQGMRLVDEAWLDQARAPLPRGTTLLRFAIPGLLAPGSYVAGIWVGDATETFQEQEAFPFEVLPAAGDPVDGRRRLIQPRTSWSSTAAD